MEWTAALAGYVAAWTVGVVALSGMISWAVARRPNQAHSRARKKGLIFSPVRTNVLVIVGGAYLMLFAIFLVVAIFGTLDEASAYDIINGPLMALIGGSLAISKDLIPGGADEDPDGDNAEEGGEHQAETKT